jgi:transcriptional regulator with XRE-family HTH domain
MKKDNAAVLLGRRIRSLRKSKDLTQEELGAKCDVHYKFIGAVERGEENPSLKTLEKIAEGLGVELFDLFRFKHEERDLIKIKKDLLETINQIEKEDTAKLQLILKIIHALK